MNPTPPEQVIRQLNLARSKNLISNYYITADMRLYIYFTPTTNSEVKLKLQGYFYSEFNAQTMLAHPDHHILRVVF